MDETVVGFGGFLFRTRRTCCLVGIGAAWGDELMDGMRNGALAGLGWATRLAVLLCGGA